MPVYQLTIETLAYTVVWVSMTVPQPTGTCSWCLDKCMSWPLRHWLTVVQVSGDHGYQLPIDNQSTNVLIKFWLINQQLHEYWPRLPMAHLIQNFVFLNVYFSKASSISVRVFFIVALYSSSELFSFYSFKELCVWIVSTKLSSLLEVML